MRNPSYSGLLYELWKYHLFFLALSLRGASFITTYNDQGRVLWMMAYSRPSGLGLSATSSERPSPLPHTEVTSSESCLMPSCLALFQCASKPQMTFPLLFLAKSLIIKQFFYLYIKCLINLTQCLVPKSYLINTCGIFKWMNAWIWVIFRLYQ